VAAGPGAATASAAYQAGAATASTTPPPFNAAQDLIDFPAVDPTTGTVCPRTGPVAFDGPRTFRFEEPYQDTNGDGEFDYNPSGGGGTAPAPEPFCDYNHNGRWDGIYTSGQIATQPKLIDAGSALDARAVAISDGSHTDVIVSVSAQGIHANYDDAAIAQAKSARPGQIDNMVVSANHNESSPDTVGIYGAPADPTGVVGLNSGIDEYYMAFLEKQVAQAADDAVGNLAPASLSTTSFVPQNACVNLSNNFPTTDDNDHAASIDPAIRVLQAQRTSNGSQIFTMMNLAAHNQEIGHGPNGPSYLSGDWPGYFANRLEQDAGGVGLFLVGDNGSEEDPSTVLDPSNSDGCGEPSGGFGQAQTTGQTLADDVNSHLSGTTPLPTGTVSGSRDDFCVPIENNLFKAAAAARLFGQRQAYDPTCTVANPAVPADVKTTVSVLNIGPSLQFLGNPGEVFPAVMNGSPFGVDEVGCPGRPNPPAPTWHASAANRFPIGLANDMIGYQIPAWAYSEIPGAFANQPPNADTCTNDPSTGLDPAGHKHKLETEGLGPSASNDVATHLTNLLDPNPALRTDEIIRTGRFVNADGTLTRKAGPNTKGVWLAAAGSNVLAPGTGKLIALPGIGFFGSVPVDANGSFMDYDGNAVADPSVANCPTDTVNLPQSVCLVTRGMRTGAVANYADVYPAIDQRATLGAAAPPGSGGGGGGGGGGGSGGSGSGGSGSGGGSGGGGSYTESCKDKTAPRARLRRSGISARGGRLSIHGHATDAGCSRSSGAYTEAGGVARVQVVVARIVDPRPPVGAGLVPLGQDVAVEQVAHLR